MDTAASGRPWKIQASTCLLRKNRSIKHDHHIIPQNRDGSHTLANTAGLCGNCHTLVNTDEEAAAHHLKQEGIFDEKR